MANIDVKQLIEKIEYIINKTSDKISDSHKDLLMGYRVELTDESKIKNLKLDEINKQVYTIAESYLNVNELDDLDKWLEEKKPPDKPKL